MKAQDSDDEYGVEKVKGDEEVKKDTKKEEVKKEPTQVSNNFLKTNDIS